MSEPSVDPETLRLMFPDALFTLAACTLVAYDILISIDRELAYIYNRRLSFVTILYVLNRVLSIVLVIAQVLSCLGFQTIFSCNFMFFLEHGAYIILLIVIGTLSSLRVFAIWGRQWFPASIIFPVFMIPVAINLWYMSIYKATGASREIPLYAVCFWVERRLVAEDTIVRWAVVTRATMILGDVMVLVATWAKTFNTRYTAKHFYQLNATNVILIDGTIYFGAQLVLNVLGLAFDQQSGPDWLACIVAYINMPVASILMSRFLLSLRDVHDRSICEEDEASGVRSEIHFLTGNIGSSLVKSHYASPIPDPNDSSPSLDDSVGPEGVNCISESCAV